MLCYNRVLCFFFFLVVVALKINYLQQIQIQVNALNAFYLWDEFYLKSSSNSMWKSFFCKILNETLHDEHLCYFYSRSIQYRDNHDLSQQNIHLLICILFVAISIRFSYLQLFFVVQIRENLLKFLKLFENITKHFKNPKTEIQISQN